MEFNSVKVKFPLICIFTLVLFSGHASSQTVQVNITSNDPTDQGLPDDINVTFTTVTNSSTEFRLVRVDYDNLPIYSIENNKGGQKIKKENVHSNENVAFYQDTKKGAVFQLSRANVTNGQLDEFIITRGHYRKGNATYSIKPRRKSRPKRGAFQNDSQSDQIYDINHVPVPPMTMSDVLNPPPEYRSSKNSNNMESQFPFGSKFKRPKRQAFSTYYIDVTAFLDSTCYSRFLRESSNDAAAALTKIREYYAFIFTGIDLVYQNFKSAKFQLRVRLTKIVIFKSTLDFPLSYFRVCYNNIYCYPSNYVNSMYVLNDFSIFLNSTKGKDLVFPYDHAMLFVGADLWTSTSNLLGIAWVQTFCRRDGMSSSLIEDTGDYSAILTGAHELGHSLSSQHDGINNTCPVADRYLMAPEDSRPTNSTSVNPWRFSNCTTNYFSTYLTALAATSSGQMCLSNTLDVIGDFPDVSQRLLGQEITAEKQCQIRLGPSSYVCQIPNTYICPSLYCWDPANPQYCYSQPALSGTSCGPGQICFQGACVNDSISFMTTSTKAFSTSTKLPTTSTTTIPTTTKTTTKLPTTTPTTTTKTTTKLPTTIPTTTKITTKLPTTTPTTTKTTTKLPTTIPTTTKTTTKLPTTIPTTTKTTTKLPTTIPTTTKTTTKLPTTIPTTTKTTTKLPTTIPTTTKTTTKLPTTIPTTTKTTTKLPTTSPTTTKTTTKLPTTILTTKKTTSKS